MTLRRTERTRDRRIRAQATQSIGPSRLRPAAVEVAERQDATNVRR
jgi:hypothetical protein